MKNKSTPQSISLRNKIASDLLQLILKASQGEQYVNIESSKNIIDNIVDVIILETKPIIYKIASEQVQSNMDY